jgi:aryl-alcohol dehydrogenase-like predicted oxidoreductase
MRYRQLGNSGLTVSVVGLGCNNFGARIDLDATRAVLDRAIDEGITLLDTADTYGNRGGSEEAIGAILGSRRDRVVLASKWGNDMGVGPDARGGRRYIRRAVEASLRRLRTDHLDLYQLHRPDPFTPISETLAALDELVAEGKVRYVGSSNFTAWQIADADWTARTTGTERMISAQNHYSLLAREAEGELLGACERFGVGLLPYFPLANGLLTGKFRRGEPLAEGTRMHGRSVSERTWDRIETLEAFAVERGHSLLELAFAGLLARPVVASVIAGATRPEQVSANVAAASWELSADDVTALDALAEGERGE